MNSGHSSAAGSPTGAPMLSGKAWASLCARAALQGLVLARTAIEDGPVRLLAQCHGVWREIRLIDDIEALVVGPAI